MLLCYAPYHIKPTYPTFLLDNTDTNVQVFPNGPDTVHKGIQLQRFGGDINDKQLVAEALQPRVPGQRVGGVGVSCKLINGLVDPFCVCLVPTSSFVHGGRTRSTPPPDPHPRQ